MGEIETLSARSVVLDHLLLVGVFCVEYSILHDYVVILRMSLPNSNCESFLELDNNGAVFVSGVDICFLESESARRDLPDGRRVAVLDSPPGYYCDEYVLQHSCGCIHMADHSALRNEVTEKSRIKKDRKTCQ